MFIGVTAGHPRTPDEAVKLAGPFLTFAEAAAHVADRPHQVVLEFCPVWGWLGFWESMGDRWECVAEPSMADHMRSCKDRPRLAAKAGEP